MPFASVRMFPNFGLFVTFTSTAPLLAAWALVAAGALVGADDAPPLAAVADGLFDELLHAAASIPSPTMAAKTMPKRFTSIPPLLMANLLMP